MSASMPVEACVLPLDGAPIALSCFDPSEELVWSASGSGMVYSHLLPTLEPYSAFRCDESMTPAVGLYPNPYGIIVLTHDAVNFFSKGGISQGPPVRRDELAGATCGCLVPSASSTRLAVVSAFDPQAPSLALLDLNNQAAVASTLSLEAPYTMALYDASSSLLCLSGADGSVAAYDLRASGSRPAGKCALFPNKTNVVCAMDLQGTTLVASALRAQLGPLGGNEYVFDTYLRTLDLRAMRKATDIFSAAGAMQVKWYFGSGTGHPQVLAASASGQLSLLDSRGGMTAPTETQLSLPDRGEQLCSLDVSATSQLICAGGSQGSFTMCADAEIEVEALQCNVYPNQVSLPSELPSGPAERTRRVAVIVACLRREAGE